MDLLQSRFADASVSILRAFLWYNQPLDSTVLFVATYGVGKSSRWPTQSSPMSVTISIAPTSDETWIIRNAVYRWLVNRVADVHPDRTDVVEQLTISGYNGGIALEHYLEESPELSIRIAHSLKTTIDHIRANNVLLTDDAGRPWPELQEQVYNALDELRHLLTRFQMDNRL